MSLISSGQGDGLSGSSRRPDLDLRANSDAESKTVAMGALASLQDDCLCAMPQGDPKTGEADDEKAKDEPKPDDKPKKQDERPDQKASDPQEKDETEARRRRFAESMNAVRNDIASKIPPKTGDRTLSEPPIVSTTPLRTAEQISNENKKINEQVTEIEKRLVKDRYDPEKREAAIKELQGVLRRLDILMYNLPDNASDADIQEAQDAEVRRCAKQFGISTDLPINELYVKVNKEAYVRSLRKEFETSCKKYGLDPEKTTYGDLRFQFDCEKYKLDPKTTTKEQALAARKADHLKHWAKYYGCPENQTAVDERRTKLAFEMDCLHMRLDPRRTTPGQLKSLMETSAKESRESWCKTYGLDPKTTTNEKFEEVHNFHVDCHMYKLDAKTASKKDLEAKIIETDSKKYGLDPKTATMKDIERMRDLEVHKRLCMRYQLDSRATTSNDLHDVRCETFGVPLTTTKEQLLDLEDRWDSRGY